MPVEVVGCPEIGEGRTPRVCDGRGGEADGIWEVVGMLGRGVGGGPPREGSMEMFFLRNAI